MDWGLGHATRCIPIIRDLLDQDCSVIIGASGRGLRLLKNEFPGLDFVELPGYGVEYPAAGAMTWKMFCQLPKILSVFIKEHRLLSEIIDEYSIKTVISDNRFGLWSKKAHCIYMTHQIQIMTPKRLKFLQPSLYELHRFIMRFYDEVWIPDYAGRDNLSGDLSHLYPLPMENAKYIGPLSRFIPMPDEPVINDLLVVLSGPEPQRSIFEELILNQIDGCGEKIIIVRGVTETNKTKIVNKNVKLVDYMTSNELNLALAQSKTILTRGGYSTLMDLAVMNKPAILAPTPGQSEQEYLAGRLKNRKDYLVMAQSEFNYRRIRDFIQANYKDIK